MRAVLVVVVLIAALSQVGCATPAQAPKSSSDGRSAEATDSSRTAPEIQDDKTLELDAGLADPQAFRASLYRSAEGTLGGEVYVLRNGAGWPFGQDVGVIVLAVSPSAVTTLIEPDVNAARSTEGKYALKGGTELLYLPIPQGTTALRIASTVQGRSLASSSTLWLEAPLESVPLHSKVLPNTDTTF